MSDWDLVGRLMIAFFGGGLFGSAYFGGLWLTVRRFDETSAATFILSFVVRMGLLLAGMYWLTAGDWRAVLVCLTGVLVSRYVLLRRNSRALPSNSG